MLSNRKLFILLVLQLAVTVHEIDADELGDSILKIHNDLRKSHGVGELKLVDELSTEAEAQAKKRVEECIETGEFKQGEPSERDYNDNTWAYISRSSSKLSAAKVTKDWIEQGSKHDYSKPAYNNATGHFTQMIWKSTDQIGVGKATGTKGAGRDKKFVTVVVVRYAPPGNLLEDGAFEENVLQPAAAGRAAAKGKKEEKKKEKEEKEEEEEEKQK